MTRLKQRVIFCLRIKRRRTFIETFYRTVRYLSPRCNVKRVAPLRKDILSFRATDRDSDASIGRKSYNWTSVDVRRRLEDLQLPWNVYKAFKVTVGCLQRCLHPREFFWQMETHLDVQYCYGMFHRRNCTYAARTGNRRSCVKFFFRLIASYDVSLRLDLAGFLFYLRVRRCVRNYGNAFPAL